MPPTIERIETFLTQPGTQRLVVVRVTASEPGLVGLGCATFTQRHLAVKAAVDHHLAPLMLGRDVRHTEDLWRLGMVNGYWRNGPVLNNALSGIDMALWDIKGKMAGMPCYELWGGLSRPAALVYTHAGGRDGAEVADRVREKLAQGFTHVRCQLGGYVGLTDRLVRPDGAPAGACFDARERLRSVPAMFDRIRAELGDEAELLHDVHERLAPSDAVQLAKALEGHRLFFLEDILAPEDLEWFSHIRSVCTTPLAMGELFNHPREWTPLIAGRLIDFIRVHLSQIGGITPALKLAHLCEAFGVRTAWHGPGDVSPVGMAAAVHLDVAVANFGIQEWGGRGEAEREIFPGMPELRPPYVYPGDRPGLGIDFREDLAARYPCDNAVVDWTQSRLPDGTLWRP